MWERVVNVVIMVCFMQVRSLEIDEPCKTNDGFPGTCQFYNNCHHAYLQVQSLRQPTRCGFQGGFTLSHLVVCCPKALDHTEGKLRKFFDKTSGPILYGPNITFRYHGEVPALACEKTKTVVNRNVEPVGCPILELENHRIDPTDIAMEKCLEYQHIAKPCLQRDVTLEYYRDEECIGEQDRIANGEKVNGTTFPHMVLLGCRNEKNNESAYIQWVAGGTLISDRFILTAGHVMSHTEYRTIRYALMGITDKNKAKDGRLYHVVRSLTHKLYTLKEKTNDIALLEVDRRVELSNFIRPACLPSPSLKIEGSTRWIAGWGQTSSYDKTPSDALMSAKLIELDYETQCKSKLSATERGYFVPGTMICAGSETKSDTCHGDSGGPLMAIAESLKCTFVVRGVVSFGPGCSSGLPGFYTNVSAYMPWIVETVWGNPKN